MPFSAAVRIVATKGEEVGHVMSCDQPEDTYVIFFFFFLNVALQGANFLLDKAKTNIYVWVLNCFFLGPFLHLCDLGLHDKSYLMIFNK